MLRNCQASNACTVISSITSTLFGCLSPNCTVQDQRMMLSTQKYEIFYVPYMYPGYNVHCKVYGIVHCTLHCMLFVIWYCTLYGIWYCTLHSTLYGIWYCTLYGIWYCTWYCTWYIIYVKDEAYDHIMCHQCERILIWYHLISWLIRVVHFWTVSC